MAEASDGMFGDGRIQGRPVSLYSMDLSQPRMGMTVRRHFSGCSLPSTPQLRPSSLMRPASSPTVRPYTYGMRNSLTKEK